MSSNEVVIVSAKRTPIGAFQGALAPLSAVQLGGVAAKAAIQSAGIGPAELEEVILGCVLPAGLGQAPARQAAIAAGVPVSVARHHGQQDVRLGTQGRDARRGADPRRLRAGRARRRTRIDVQRPLPAAQGAHRLPHGSRRGAGPYVLRRAAEPLRRQAHGLLRGRDGGEVPVQPRPAGRLRRRVRAARAAGGRGRRLRRRDRAGHGEEPQGRDRGGAR